MLSAQAVGTAETYWGHEGPYVVESIQSDESSSRSGEAQRPFPTGGYEARHYHLV
jgi:hypothetical protein